MKQAIVKEMTIVRKMIEVYCRGQKHDRPSAASLCEACEDLYVYAQKKLTLCPAGKEKPFCSQCPKHCYKPIYRQAIKEVMIYAGPRMLLYHPLVALRHMLTRFRSRKKWRWRESIRN